MCATYTSPRIHIDMDTSIHKKRHQNKAKYTFNEKKIHIQWINQFYHNRIHFNWKETDERREKGIPKKAGRQAGKQANQQHDTIMMNVECSNNSKFHQYWIHTFNPLNNPCNDITNDTLSFRRYPFSELITLLARIMIIEFIFHTQKKGEEKYPETEKGLRQKSNKYTYTYTNSTQFNSIQFIYSIYDSS